MLNNWVWIWRNSDLFQVIEVQTHIYTSWHAKISLTLDEHGMFFIQTSTLLPPSMHRELTEQRHCMQNYQIPTFSHPKVLMNQRTTLISHCGVWSVEIGVGSTIGSGGWLRSILGLTIALNVPISEGGPKSSHMHNSTKSQRYWGLKLILRDTKFITMVNFMLIYHRFKNFSACLWSMCATCLSMNSVKCCFIWWLLSSACTLVNSAKCRDKQCFLVLDLLA